MFAICHTHYSLQTGIGSPQAWVDAALERGYAGLAVADVNGLYGAVEFVQAAEKAGLRAIVGATLILDRDSYCVVLAPDDRGYRQLCRLLTARHLSASFTLEPVADDIDALVFLARQGGVLHRLSGFVSPSSSLPWPRPIAQPCSPCCGTSFRMVVDGFTSPSRGFCRRRIAFRLDTCATCGLAVRGEIVWFLGRRGRCCRMQRSGVGGFPTGGLPMNWRNAVGFAFLSGRRICRGSRCRSRWMLLTT